FRSGGASHGPEPAITCLFFPAGSAVAADHRDAVLHFDLRTRIMVHARGVHGTVVFVLHVVADDLGNGVVDGLADPLVDRFGGVFLVVLLDLVARVATRHRAGHGGQFLAVAATDLVAQQATGHGADRGPGDLVLVLDRLVHGHRSVLAFLVRVVGGLLDRRGADHLGILRTFRTGVLVTSRQPDDGQGREPQPHGSFQIPVHDCLASCNVVGHTAA